MVDCLSCLHAQPVRGPDGRFDFQRKMCIRRPPTPVPLPSPGPGGTMQLQIVPMFPVVGAGVRCGDHEQKLIGDEAPEAKAS